MSNFKRRNTSLELKSSYEANGQSNKYPLVTHDPNMLKNKSRGNLVGKIKVSLPEGKYENFRQKQFVQYQAVHMLCSIPDQLGPFSRLINF